MYRLNRVVIAYLDSSDDLDVVHVPFYKACSTITLDPSGLPSADIVNGHITLCVWLDSLIAGRNFILENDMAFPLHFLRRQEIQRYTIDEVGKMEYTESAMMDLV